MEITTPTIPLRRELLTSRSMAAAYQIVTAGQAAKILGISLKHFNRWAEAIPQLPRRGPAGWRHYRLADIHAFLQRRRKPRRPRRPCAVGVAIVQNCSERRHTKWI